jgi:hypothetical protein
VGTQTVHALLGSWAAGLARAAPFTRAANAQAFADLYRRALAGP